MGYLNQIDASFLHMESESTPMQVAGLMVFKLPKDAPDTYLEELYDSAIQSPVTLYPFNCKLKVGILSGIAPYWVEDEDIEIEYHVRRSALPKPGGEKELGILVERLHSHPLDMSRPLWEFHLIEGLEENRFALYFKSHHSAIDGMGAMNLITRWLSDNPTNSQVMAPWSMPSKRPKAKPDIILPKAERNFFSRSIDAVKSQANAATELSKALYHMGKPSENPEGGMASVLHTPTTPFNVHTSKHRRVATQLYNTNRLKAIAKASEATVNDVAMATLGGSLRRYLQDQNELPEHPLVASVPISIRTSTTETGNAIAGFVCPLETHIESPVERLANIRNITSRTKSQLQGMSKKALKQFSFMGIAPMMISQVTGLGASIPPLFNLVFSNVMTPKKKLYFNGAQLEALYPVSLLFDGYALNVTMVGIGSKLSFGFVGCRKANPSLQKLAVYTGDALSEMEDALALKNGLPKKTPTKNSKQVVSTTLRSNKGTKIDKTKIDKAKETAINESNREINSPMKKVV